MALAAALTAMVLALMGRPAHAGEAQSEWVSRVPQLVVTRTDGGRELGSAVSIGGERMVTNCHVVRSATRIEVRQGSESWLAKAERGDAYRDLCFLSVPGYAAESVPMIEVGQTRVGLPVVAVGHSGGELAVSEGGVIGLHTCECDGGKVIQTSAPFDRGASGGGLFDHEGRLVGILAFKSTRGGRFHFALPVGWLRYLADQPVASRGGEEAFWESPGKGSDYFLAACDLSAKQRWPSLFDLASRWSEQEPTNPEAWMALGQAQLGLKRTDAAALAYQRALMLDPVHAEAQWALQQLEFELGRSLLAMDGI